MANKGRLNLDGMGKHLEALAAMGRDIDAAAAAGLQAGAEVAQDGMQERVRKDTHNLEDHIVINGPHADGNLIFMDVGLIGADAETARYGNAQEFGTQSMDGQSYIRATMDSDKGKIRAAIVKGLQGGGA